MEDLAKINKEKEKFYKSEQKKIDSNSEYRDYIIRAREQSIMRSAKTGFMDNYDDYLQSTFLMTMPPKERDRVLKRLSEINIFNL